jgi:hypothetical protein
MKLMTIYARTALCHNYFSNRIRKLNYMLSFLGIADSIEITSQDATSSPPAATSDTVPAIGDLGPPAYGDDIGPEPWSEITSKRQHQRQHRSDSLQQSVVAAVYVDQSLQKRRESSLIATGLQSVTGTSDKDLFASLCLAEYNIRPDIVATRRLGHSKPGKTQPLLVHLKQVEQAQHFISHAKSLRHSSNEAVREKVFINRNMTKAEAAAAYQIRLQRRQAQMRRQQNQNTETTDRAVHSSLPAAVNPTPLNPSADVFNPSTPTVTVPV